MGNLLKILGNFIVSHPIWFVLILIGLVIGFKFGLRVLRRVHASRMAKKRVFFRITMPREDSPRDKDKEVEKDFREKIAMMAQFFRNLEETREMNIWNVIRTRILKDNVFSFELVAEDKHVNFYVSSPPYYAGILEKQITSYYQDAEVLPVEPYQHLPEGNKAKAYYAYLEKPYWFPIKTFKKIENDPLNDLTNIFSSMKDGETGIYQIVIIPKSDKWQKKAEKQGSLYFQGGKASKLSTIPIIGSVYALLSGIIFGYESYKQNAPKKDGETGYVRMLQTKEEVAKSIGEKSQRAGFDTVIRILATAKTEDRAEEIKWLIELYDGLITLEE